MTRLALALVSATTLLACAPAPQLDADARARSASGVNAVVDVSCADPACSQLFLDGAGSTADGNGVAAYSWVLPDGSTSSEAWVFVDVHDQEVADRVEFSAVDEDGDDDQVIVDLLGDHFGDLPDTSAVWTPWTVTNGGASCAIRANIGGCLQGVQAVTFKAAPSASRLASTSGTRAVVEPEQYKLRGPSYTVEEDSSIVLSITKDYGDDQKEERYRFHCRDGLSKL